MNRLIAVSCLLLSGLFAQSRADAQSASDEAAADALFEEGVLLRNTGDHAAACDRFERSQSLDPALGTLQNIGMCLQKQGKLVAALGRFSSFSASLRRRLTTSAFASLD
jgi:tetratricopeptide (TPR) repeat protein